MAGSGKTTTCTKYAYYHQRKVGSQLLSVLILLELAPLISWSRTPPKLKFHFMEGTFFHALHFILFCSCLQTPSSSNKMSSTVRFCKETWGLQVHLFSSCINSFSCQLVYPSFTPKRAHRTEHLGLSCFNAISWPSNDTSCVTVTWNWIPWKLLLKVWKHLKRKSRSHNCWHEWASQAGGCSFWRNASSFWSNGSIWSFWAFSLGSLLL